MAHTFSLILIFIFSTSCCLAQYGSHNGLRLLQQTNASTKGYAAITDGSYSINDRENWLRLLRERRSKKHRYAPTSKWTPVALSKARIPVVLKAVAPQPAPQKHVVIPELKAPVPWQSKKSPPAGKYVNGKAIECYGKHCIRSLRKRRSRKYRSAPKSKHVAIPHSKSQGEFLLKAMPNSKVVMPPVTPQKYIVVPEVKVPEPQSSKNYVTEEFVPAALVEARQSPSVKAASAKVPARTIANCYGKHCIRSLRKRESRKYRSAPSSKHVSNHPEVKTFVLSKYAVEPVVKVPRLPPPQKYVVAPKMIAVPRTKAPHPYKGKY